MSAIFNNHRIITGFSKPRLKSLNFKFTMATGNHFLNLSPANEIIVSGHCYGVYITLPHLCIQTGTLRNFRLCRTDWGSALTLPPNGTYLCTQNSSDPVYGIGLYLNKSHIWPVWHRSRHSKLVISSAWKSSVLKEISYLGCMAQVCALNIRHIEYME